jgi:hypothetical protein
MNKQIENLMYHAGLTASGSWDEMDDYDRQAIERLALLIVRECIEVANNNRTGMETKTNTHLTADAIKQHFGVE